MARKELKYTVTGNDRDTGKLFVITEMSTRRGHAWATRLLFAVMNSGIDVSPQMLNAGVAGLAVMGLMSLRKMPYDVAQPLLDEMLEGIEIIPDVSKQNIKRALIPDDIEEVATMFKLQHAVWDLHTEPFTSGAKSISELAPKSNLAG